jgi:four helix bundle protein
MKENVIQIKSYSFAIKVVKIVQLIRARKKEFDITKQLLRSGTSIGANVEEAIGGYSKKDFIRKIQISYKEARESDYWIRILFDTDYLEKEEYDSLEADITEILKILTAILNSSKTV